MSLGLIYLVGGNKETFFF